MRTFRSLALLGLAASSQASSLDRRTSTLDTRDLLDVCASLDVGLTVKVAGISVVVGVLDVCLCISAIPTFISTNVVALAAVALVGKSAVTTEITALINAHAPAGGCSYPEYAIPKCDGKNPCGFSCPSGFVASPASKPTKCVCPTGKYLCNGSCTDKPCPTGKPYSKREKRWFGSGSCNSRGGGHMACGVYGGGPRAWECIDTANDLESCGGCMLPLTPYTPLAVDCSAIPGVSHVSCSSGKCVVHKCMAGYTLSSDATHCVANSSGDRFEIPASQYGLEHVPLGGH